MTKLADEVFKQIIEHYEELSTLVKTDEDRDAFQDTVLWMAEHTRSCENFVRKFRTRFKYIRIENYRPLIPLTHEVPDTSEPYSEKVSDEYAEDVIYSLRNAILTEKEESKPRVRRR